MRKYILFLFALCIGLASCVKDNVDASSDGMTVFKAVYADEQTKTVLGGLTPMWVPGDKISVFDGENNEFSSSISEPSAKAEFKGVLAGQGRQHYLAVSPYSADYTFYMLGKTAYGLVMPQEQTAVEGTYDPSALISMAYTTDNTLNFKNLGSLIKFTVASEGVTSVLFKSKGQEKLSGNYFARYDDPIVINVKEGSNQVMLSGEFKKGSTYYIVTLPAVLESGFTVVLNDSVTAMDYKEIATLNRSGLVNLGELSLTPSQTPGDNPDQPAGPDAEEGAIYLKPNANWLDAGARFAAYFWQDGQPEAWVDLVQDTESGVYKCTAPAGYANVIFVRMNPASAENNWDNKWGQTADLLVPTGDDVCYVINADSWDAGYWTSYPPTGAEPENPGTDNPGTVVPSDGVKVYLKPNSNWLEAGARFAAYLWETGRGEVWVNLVADTEAGVYTCTTPAGYSNIIFVRMDPSKPANTWDNKWGQTTDLFVPTGDSVCYVINDGSWDAGYWTVYPPVGGGSDQGGNSGDQGDDSGSQGGDSGDQGDTVTACRLVIKVNKSINWYDKYLYTWDSNGPTTGAWPGTKTNWDKEEGNYYVYYYDLPASCNGKTINYIINCGSGGSGNQTADLTVAITGAQTIVVIEPSHVN